MKFSSLFLSFCISATTLALVACADSNTSFVQTENFTGIIGGKELTIEDAAANYVVMLFDKEAEKICTGVLVAKNVVLTAAHCLSKKSDGLKVVFGVAPMTGKYVSRISTEFKIYPTYKEPHINDIALVIFNGGAPAPYKPIQIAPKGFPLKEGYLFTAIGYGRISGKDADSSDKQGMARLRSVFLKIKVLEQGDSTFIADQTQSAGVCNGDSGGPALMRYKKSDYVVGVVSTVVWDKSAKDVCSDRSRYMKVSTYEPWITKTLKDAR